MALTRRTFLYLGALGGALLAAGCGGPRSPGAAGSGQGVLEVAQANQGGAFLRAIESAGLSEQLAGRGPYTLFVPNDAAFRGARLPSDREALRRALAHHVVPGQVGTSFMTGLEMNHLTSAGTTLNVNGRGSGIRVGGANLIRADLPARNGVVHIVDRVLVPS